MIYLVSFTLILLAGFLGFYIGRRQAGQQASPLALTIKDIKKGLLNSEHLSQQAVLTEVGEDLSTTVQQLAGNMRRITMQSDSIAACINELNEMRDVLDGDAKESMSAMDATRSQFNQLDQVIEEIRKAVGESTGHMDKVSEATQVLSSDITHIASSAEQASANVTTMASAAEEMTANLTAVNSSLQDVNGASSNVAAAVEQMTASLEEVRRRCALASQETETASSYSQSTQSVMDELSKSAAEIGRFISMINSIADQTNMLALNAAIEAAGAGEAGKGFAVVANEVKELASQTAEATKLISEQVSIIQQHSDTAGKSTLEVTRLVSQVNQANQEITLAVDEQNSALQEISSSLSSVSRSSDDVTRNAAELQDAANEVARAAQEAATGTQVIAHSASRSAEAAESMLTLSEQTTQHIHAIHEQTGVATRSAEISEKNINRVYDLANYIEGSTNTFSILTDVVQGAVESLRASQVSYVTGADSFDVRNVKEGHLAWLRRLEQAVRGRISIPPQDAAQYRKCAFGQWYYGEGQSRYANDPLFTNLGSLHESVHAAAVEALEMVERQEPREAILPAIARFGLLRTELFDALDKLYMSDVQDEQKMIVWEDALDVGVKQLNDDHLVLIDYINTLHSAMKNGLGRDKMAEVLAGLTDFTKTHFAREEAMMKKHGYGRYSEQCAEHVKLLDDLAQKQRDFESGSATVALDLISFLHAWLVDHILGEDMQYKRFFNQKGVH
uniref:Putative methyl-accepting chemotaxis sensory transducer n=1 Tax=Magnetococcus massalia (strain MO-1) TaxID=451514 RepID=A0A1S7LNR4_MAGMO|nr:Putative methyl-accepting chemotaxis sensory transducer [Candidatus Magnetococcus massalia]